ncbi:MAG: hypothetical protein QXS54_03285 [Candidatus Methanomethylicaceae archaeon]
MLLAKHKGATRFAYNLRLEHCKKALEAGKPSSPFQRKTALPGVKLLEVGEHSLVNGDAQVYSSGCLPAKVVRNSEN